MGNKFFLKELFLGGNFGGADSLREEILPAKFLENFFK